MNTQNTAPDFGEPWIVDSARGVMDKDGNVICYPFGDFMAEAEIQAMRADIEAASGELRVPMPEPGTDMARVMVANAIMRDQRDEAKRENEAMRAAIVEAHSVLRNILHNYECGPSMDADCEAALAKLKPFLP